MQTGISRWAVRALGILCLALPLTLPTAAEAAKAKPHATAKGKHKVAAKKHKVVAKKAKAAKHAQKAKHRKLAKAHPPKAKPQRNQPAAGLNDAEAGRLALPGKPGAETAQEAHKTARTACAIDGKVYLLADCQQLVSN